MKAVSGLIVLPERMLNEARENKMVFSANTYQKSPVESEILSSFVNSSMLKILKILTLTSKSFSTYFAFFKEMYMSGVTPS